MFPSLLSLVYYIALDSFKLVASNIVDVQTEVSSAVGLTAKRSE